jgi:hypothetical protein
MKTNVEILAAAYAGTQRAADDMAALQTAVDGGACITSAELLPKLGKLRNELRDALNAVQELKTRAKKAQAGAQKGKP